MSLNEDDVKQIIKFIDESKFEELHLNIGDLKLFVSKRRGGAQLQKLEPPASDQNDSTVPAPPAAEAIAAQAAASPFEPPQGGRGQGQAAEAELLADEGLVPISAPTLGIFYRASKPGAPPFVEEGSLVSESDTVCIIEVMKLFNHIKAGLRGRVAKICADNGQMVEHNQILFLIEPENN